MKKPLGKMNKKELLEIMEELGIILTECEKQGMKKLKLIRIINTKMNLKRDVKQREKSFRKWIDSENMEEEDKKEAIKEFLIENKD